MQRAGVLDCCSSSLLSSLKSCYFRQMFASPLLNPGLSVSEIRSGCDSSQSYERTVPSRIPGYVVGDNSTYYVYVMREPAHRILSWHVVRMADVLVLFHELPLAHDPSVDPLVDPSVDPWVGSSFVRHAEKEGHRVHVTTSLSDGRVHFRTGSCLQCSTCRTERRMRPSLRSQPLVSPRSAPRPTSFCVSPPRFATSTVLRPQQW